MEAPLVRAIQSSDKYVALKILQASLLQTRRGSTAHRILWDAMRYIRSTQQY
jgi:hypothetical protein